MSENNKEDCTDSSQKGQWTYELVGFDWDKWDRTIGILLNIVNLSIIILLILLVIYAIPLGKEIIFSK